MNNQVGGREGKSRPLSWARAQGQIHRRKTWSSGPLPLHPCPGQTHRSQREQPTTRHVLVALSHSASSPGCCRRLQGSLCLHVSRTVRAGSLQGAAGLAGVLGPQPKSAALGTWQRRHLVCYHQLHAAREETEPQRLTPSGDHRPVKIQANRSSFEHGCANSGPATSQHGARADHA